MRIITENNLCENRPYINLKKLSIKTTIRVGSPDESGLKTTYLIDQHTQSLSKNTNYTQEYSNGIEKLVFYKEDLDNLLLVEVNYSTRSGDASAKFKVYVVLDGIKYVLSFNDFEDIYEGCMDILSKEIKDSTELNYIKAGFNNLEKDEKSVDINLNLERLAEFKDKVNYKRNVDYFVINNITASISKYDIKNKAKTIEISDRVHVLRYNRKTRHYFFVKPIDKSTVNLNETDLICDLGDDNTYPKVSIYTEYGLGKLLDVENNVIPTANTLSLFANLLDLGLDILN